MPIMNKSHEKSQSSSACSTPINGAVALNELSDTFYTSQRKGHVFRVRLNGHGFTLQRESPSGTKEQTVKICDIVGARCMRLKKTRRLANACACSSGNTTSPATSRAAAAAATSATAAGTPSKCSTASKEDYHQSLDYDGDVSAYLYVFAYVLKKKSLRSHLHRERTVLTLRFRSFDTFEDNMREAERWYRALRWQLQQTFEDIFVAPRSENERRRRVLVLLNPKSGSGKAREMFNAQVAPVLNEAEVPYDLYVTKHPNYACEFVRTRRLDIWCCVMALGGDGLFHEIVNGLLQREDWQQVLRETALGIVPCGSGNGLARSIAHGYNEPYGSKPILGSVLTVISGQTTAMDVVRVQLPSRAIYSFLSIGWGLISDIDIESERLRAIGYQRFTIWTLYRLANLRTYRGKLSYLPKDQQQQQPPINILQPLRLQHSRSCNNATHIDKLANPSFHQSSEYLPPEFEDVISLETSINHSFRSRCDSWLSSGSRRSCYYSISESVYHSLAGESDYSVNGAESPHPAFGPASSLPDLQQPLSSADGWCVEQGDFIMVHATYQTHLGTDCHFAPKALLNDGTIYLIVIRGGISRPQLLNFLINMSTGTHLPEKNGEFVKVLPVHAFRLEPYDDHGIITVDGERVQFGPLQAEILPGIARVMIPK